MGTVCDTCIGNSRHEENLFQLPNNKRLSTTMIDRSVIYKKIEQISNFIDGHELPEQMRQKYILQLIQIREELIQQMFQHTDKFDGYCPTRECVQGFEFRDGDNHLNPWLDKRSMNVDSSFSWNPQDGSISVERTNCSKGSHLNQCMDLCIKNLKQLNYFEENNQQQIYSAFILQY